MLLDTWLDIAGELAGPPAAAAAAADLATLRAEDLTRRLGSVSTRDMLAALILSEFPGKIALVSSFGAESAVLLHHVAEIDRTTPVIFIDTGRLFAETQAYRRDLTARLGLTDVRIAGPDATLMRQTDPDLDLWSRDADRCCSMRKVIPLTRALAGFDAWLSGRKRYQGGARAALPLVETDRRLIKINPLARWSPAEIADYIRKQSLPIHPMTRNGFRSIGCVPCTAPARSSEAARDGRWRGTEKTECGIHLGLDVTDEDSWNRI